MATLEQLYELRDRLERATGPDRALDAAIASAFGIPIQDERCEDCGHGSCAVGEVEVYIRGCYTTRVCGNCGGTGSVSGYPEVYTSSLDVVAALHERLLPGWEYSLLFRREGIQFQLHRPDVSYIHLTHVAYAPTGAIAWLRAIVAALIAEAEKI